MPSPRLVTASSLLLLTIMGVSYQAEADGRPGTLVHRSLLCGAITVTSDTVLSNPDNEFDAKGFSQVMRLSDMSKNRTVALPIFQHFSRERSLHGNKVLDGSVWAFECGSAPSGQAYVKLLWGCTNPDAETCSPAEDADDEWRALYDSSGHHLPADPRKLTSADEQEMKRLGLWDFLMHDDLDKNGGFTYFHKQVDPNGHIR